MIHFDKVFSSFAVGCFAQIWCFTMHNVPMCVVSRFFFKYIFSLSWRFFFVLSARECLACVHYELYKATPNTSAQKKTSKMSRNAPKKLNLIKLNNSSWASVMLWILQTSSKKRNLEYFYYDEIEVCSYAPTPLKKHILLKFFTILSII